jgi:hypothetical protein
MAQQAVGRVVQQRDHGDGDALKSLQEVLSAVAQHRSSRERLDQALAGRRFVAAHRLSCRIEP